MKRYLIVVHISHNYIVYYESLSRDALDHLKRENSSMFGDRKAYDIFGAKEVDVIELGRKVAVSGAYVEGDGVTHKCHRKSKEKLAEINKDIESYLKKVYFYGVGHECTQSGTAN